MNVRNVHERRLRAPSEIVGRLIDQLAATDDRLWPRDRWPAMRFDRPLAIGAVGGHGPIRYVVESYDRSRRIRFRFCAPRGFDGCHEFAVRDDGSGSVIRHELSMR